MRFLGRKNKKPDAKQAKSVPVQRGDDASSDGNEQDSLDTPWARLEDAVRKNPLFKLTTVDGMRWIDPFSGSLHSAPFGPIEVALDYYRNNEGIWKGKKPRSLAMLHYHRLHIFLREEIQNDERLRLFHTNVAGSIPFQANGFPRSNKLAGA